MYLGNTEFRIHGTNQLSTIGTGRICWMDRRNAEPYGATLATFIPGRPNMPQPYGKALTNESIYPNIVELAVTAGGLEGRIGPPDHRVS
jgi:hypothetical protein